MFPILPCPNAAFWLKTARIVAAGHILSLLLVSVQTILLALASIAVVSTCYSASAHGAEFSLQPAITVSEEYTDNLFLTTTNRSEDYITRIVPSIRWTYKAPLWDWDVAYAYDHRYYAKFRDDQDLYTLDLKNHTRILGDFLQLDVEDVHARKPLSVVRDWTQESLFLNQTDINTFIVTPYIRMRPSPELNRNSRILVPEHLVPGPHRDRYERSPCVCSRKL